MKGATIGHAEAAYRRGRYLRLTGPASSPRAAQPDRQRAGDPAGYREAPGGIRAHRARRGDLPRRVGTTEELLYLLGILMHPDNAGHPFPVVLTGPTEVPTISRRWTAYVGSTLGPAAPGLYEIIIAIRWRLRSR